MDNIININKSQVKKLNFPSEDVIILKTDKQKRLNRLKKAVKLGLNEVLMVGFIVKDSHKGLFRIKSQILTLSKKFVTLKGGKAIPVNCIKKVELVD